MSIYIWIAASVLIILLMLYFILKRKNRSAAETVEKTASTQEPYSETENHSVDETNQVESKPEAAAAALREKLDDIAAKANEEVNSVVFDAEEAGENIKNEIKEAINKLEVEADNFDKDVDTITESAVKSLEENKAKLNSAAEKASTEAEEAKSEVKNFAEKARDIFEESKKVHVAAVSDIVKSAVDTEGTLFVELAASDKEAQGIKNGFVSIDVETTGIDAKSNDITAIAAVKYIDGIKVDAFYTDIKPSDVEESNDPDIKDALDKFFDFLKHDGKTLPIVTHFSRFAMNFLKRKSEENKIPVKTSYFDICKLSKITAPDLADRKLNTLSTHYGIIGHESNDAVSDASAVGEIFLKMTE